MNGQQRAVLWIGLILVGLNLVGHWAEIKSVIFSGAGITSGITGGASSSSGGGGITIPDPGNIVDPAMPPTFHLGASTTKTKTTLV